MKRGFTLLELIIVVIILGVLASVALPIYFNAVERGRSAEGVNILGALRSSQLRYGATRGLYDTDYTGLDVDIATRFFTTVTVAGGTPEFPPSNVLALGSVQRNALQNPFYGAYALTIFENGDIACTGGAANACARVGY